MYSTICKALYVLLACHFVGDYVLQNSYIAQKKNQDFYHLLIHCILYTVPYAIWIGLDIRILILFFSHLLIDWMKGYTGRINYQVDQILHAVMTIIIYFQWIIKPL